VTVFTATRWQDNGALIEDVPRLGYLDKRVLDSTYGYGAFWSRWRPIDLVACDLDPAKSPIGYSVDFRALPFDDQSVNTVGLAPPYKLNRTPSDVDERYGVHVPTRWRERHELIRAGITECSRGASNYLLLKCMDQVCSGRKRWQTIEFTTHAPTVGLRLEDRFDKLVTRRPQPEGRRLVHTQGNYSSLLVFRKRNR